MREAGAAAATGAWASDCVWSDLIIRVALRPGAQAAQTTQYTNNIASHPHPSIWPCHTLSIKTPRKPFTPRIRQDVQKQLRQRLRHIVSPLVIRDTSQDFELTLYSSPQGRIFQVEYAQEAVKQGSVVVGIVSKTHAVLAAIKVSLPSLKHIGQTVFANTQPSATQKSFRHTRRRSSPSTPTTASPSPVLPPMPASSPTSCANSPSPRA